MTAVTTGLLGVDITATPTSNSTGHQLGTHVSGNDNTEWVYVQAGEALTQYDCVAIDEDFTAKAMTKAQIDDGFNVGFAQVAFTSGDYGWVAVRGSNINCRVQPGTTADGALYIGINSAGVLDTNSSGGTNIDGVTCVAAGDSAGGSISSVEVLATYPRSTTF